ncbi:unnamed protein product [Closterium sp. NIES-64]|nr:unnamed protein product [Closterium sp. Naga37s-1]CAI5934214.1 unnamed protein product [Closterium sp. NIES-64]CAI5947245.1 unnamed protein product [Closterium sp. NIES-65]CAI5973133.1 unnamed protein product [Closterium sp. NIES-65]CAI5976437.1 unnamed protein product [Closterium sp. NIES-64]
MAYPNASDDLVWVLLNQGHCYKARTAVGSKRHLSREPNNLVALHSRKYTGLAAGKTVAIRATGKGQNLEMTITHPDKAHKPAEAREVIVLKKDMPQIAKNITDRLKTYEPRLNKAALAYAYNLHKALRRSERGQVGTGSKHVAVR